MTIGLGPAFDCFFVIYHNLILFLMSINDNTATASLDPFCRNKLTFPSLPKFRTKLFYKENVVAMKALVYKVSIIQRAIYIDSFLPCCDIRVDFAQCVKATDLTVLMNTPLPWYYYLSCMNLDRKT